MATLQQLLAFRDRLKDSRYSGVRKVRDSNGEEIEFRSDSELARAMAALETEIVAAQSHAVSIIYPKTSKGV